MKGDDKQNQLFETECRRKMSLRFLEMEKENKELQERIGSLESSVSSTHAALGFKEEKSKLLALNYELQGDIVQLKQKLNLSDRESERLKGELEQMWRVLDQTKGELRRKEEEVQEIKKVYSMREVSQTVSTKSYSANKCSNTSQISEEHELLKVKYKAIEQFSNIRIKEYERKIIDQKYEIKKLGNWRREFGQMKQDINTLLTHYLQQRERNKLRTQENSLIETLKNRIKQYQDLSSLLKVKLGYRWNDEKLVPSETIPSIPKQRQSSIQMELNHLKTILRGVLFGIGLELGKESVSDRELREEMMEFKETLLRIIE